MCRLRFLVAGGLVGATCLLLTAGQPQPAAKKAPPKLEPVAETKVIMVGLAEPNLRGLGQLLKARPKDADAWVFARGQALLVAETGNLLMLRPPNGRDAQDTWMSHAGELRDNAAGLAKATAEQDYVQARASLAATANVCNRCHQTFRGEEPRQPLPRRATAHHPTALHTFNRVRTHASSRRKGRIELTMTTSSSALPWPQ